MPGDLPGDAPAPTKAADGLGEGGHVRGGPAGLREPLPLLGTGQEEAEGQELESGGGGGVPAARLLHGLPQTPGGGAPLL